VSDVRHHGHEGASTYFKPMTNILEFWNEKGLWAVIIMDCNEYGVCSYL